MIALPENAASRSPSLTHVSNNLKALLYHPDFNVLDEMTNVIRQADHCVAATTKSTQLPVLIAKFEPHLVVIGGDTSGPSPLTIALELWSWGFTFPLHLLKNHRPTSHDYDRIAQLLSQPPMNWQAVSYPTQRWLHLQDEEYLQHASAGKLNRPKPDPNGEKQADEIARFTTHLIAARQHHARAKQYLTAARRTHRGLDWDCAYRTVHGSCKVFGWKTQGLRYVSVLAHYLPGLEIECLPRPCAPSPQVDYLHYRVPPEGLYALSAVLTLGMKESLGRSVCFTLARKFQGQAEYDLIFEATHQAGVAAVLRRLCEAHVRTMDLILNINSPFYGATPLNPRDVHEIGTYCDLWDFLHLRYSPRLWQTVARDCLSSVNGEHHHGDSAVSFAEFLRRKGDLDHPE